MSHIPFIDHPVTERTFSQLFNYFLSISLLLLLSSALNVLFC